MKLHWYALKKLSKELDDANRGKAEFPYFSSLVAIYKFCNGEEGRCKRDKDRKNTDWLKDVPEKIAPDELLKKTKRRMEARERFRVDGTMFEESTRFKEPTIGTFQCINHFIAIIPSFENKSKQYLI